MADPQRKEQIFQSNIIDPASFLNLNPQQQEEKQRSYSGSDDGEYVPEPVDQQQNKNEDMELYQPQSNLLDEEQEEKYNQEIPAQSETQRAGSRNIHMAASELEIGGSVKNQVKKRKKYKKKDTDSQEEEYSVAEYSNRRRNKGKDSKKSSRKSQSNRGRGKPRGRGNTKPRQTRMLNSTQDRKAERQSQKLKPQTLLRQSSVSFNSNWKVGGDFQQDWDSQNASIYSQSIHKRFQCPVHLQILNLIETPHEKPQDLIESIRRLSSALYSTIN